MKDWQKTLAKPYQIWPAMAFLMLLAGAFAADNCSCASPADIAALNNKLNTVLDDSASMRRQIDLQLRQIDELSARPWATPDDVLNFSQNLTALVLDTANAQNAKIDKQTETLTFKIEMAKMVSVILVMLAIVCFFALSTVIYGEKYEQIYRRLGVFPRRTPMTQRESDLEKEVQRLTELNKDQPAEKPPTRLKNVIVFFIMLAVASALVYGAGLLMGAW